MRKKKSDLKFCEFGSIQWQSFVDYVINFSYIYVYNLYSK